jgi:hypothetical protein
MEHQQENTGGEMWGKSEEDGAVLGWMYPPVSINKAVRNRVKISLAATSFSNSYLGFFSFYFLINLSFN